MEAIISDFEYLYMIRQNCDASLYEMMDKYDRLLWKLSHENFMIQKPEGIQVGDLYQVGRLGLIEALYTYQESRGVGLARYVKVCVETHIKSTLRVCRSKSYKMLDTAYSLDISIAEDESLRLEDIVECDYLEFNPVKQALLQESRKILEYRLRTLKESDREVYELWKSGYSYKEIADQCHTCSKSVDNTIQKIKRLANGS